MKSFNKIFCLFLVCHFVLWSLIPCFRQMLPLDTIEAIFWGTIQDWGTNKHPPLSGVLAYYTWLIGGKTDLSIYILNQIIILTAFLFTFKIAKCFLNEKKALISTLLMEGILYYNFLSVEYNVNVVSLALWPITTYFFIQAIQKNHWTDWTFMGLFAGINILNKYVCGVLLLCFILYLIGTKKGRQRLCSFSPYLAGIICFITILPHLLWLVETKFFVVDYFLGRGESGVYKPINHLIFPLKFLINQIAFLLPVILSYFLIFKKKETDGKNKEAGQLLFCVGILPLIITVCVSAVLGTKLRTMWGFPLLYLMPLTLFYFFPRTLDIKAEKRTIKVAFIFLILFVLAYLGQIAFNKNKNFQTNPTQLVQVLNQKWQNVFPEKPLKYVGGHTWWTSMMYVYNPETQNILYHMLPHTSRWFNMDNIKENGLMVFSENEAEFQAWQKEYPALSGPYLYQHKTHNWFKKEGLKNMYYGFIKE